MDNFNSKYNEVVMDLCECLANKVECGKLKFKRSFSHVLFGDEVYKANIKTSKGNKKIKIKCTSDEYGQNNILYINGKYMYSITDGDKSNSFIRLINEITDNDDRVNRYKFLKDVCDSIRRDV